MNENELIELLENEGFPSVRDTHNGRVYDLRRLILIVLPNGQEVQGMMYGNNSGEYCRSLDDFEIAYGVLMTTCEEKIKIQKSNSMGFQEFTSLLVES